RGAMRQVQPGRAVTVASVDMVSTASAARPATLRRSFAVSQRGSSLSRNLQGTAFLPADRTSGPRAGALPERTLRWTGFLAPGLGDWTPGSARNCRMRRLLGRDADPPREAVACGGFSGVTGRASTSATR